MLSYARVLVNLDVAKSYPRFLSVELESDATLEVEVLYENIPYSECLSTGHLSTNCPYRVKLALLKSPTQAALLKTPPTIVDAGSASVPEVSANATKVPVVISISEVSGSLALVSEDSVSLATLAIAPIISGNAQSYSHPTNGPPKLPPSTNGSHTLGLNPESDPQYASPIMALSWDVVHVILEKNLAPILDCSNPFFVFEHYTFADPTSFTSKSKNLIDSQSNSVATISGPPTLTIAALCDTTLPKTSNYSSDLPVVNNPIHVR